MGTFKGVMLADLHLHMHIASAPFEDIRESEPVQEDGLPSAEKHQHNTATGIVGRSLVCFSNLQRWCLLAKPVHLGRRYKSKSPCRGRAGKVYFLSAWCDHCPCRCGQGLARLLPWQLVEQVVLWRGLRRSLLYQSSSALSLV